MHAIPSALLVAALTLTAFAPIGAADPSVTVHLNVFTDLMITAGEDPGDHTALPGTAQCEVTVPAGASAEDVLDQAVVDGCILSWSGTQFGGDTFVDEVDGLRAVGLTCIAYPTACQWWEVRSNGAAISTGVNAHLVSEGEVLTFFFHTA